MSKFTIPTVSLKDYLSNDESRKKRFIDTVGMALSEVGFFALSDHNLSDEEIAEAYEKSQDFFGLSTEVKKSYVIPGIQGQRGFTAFGVEHAKDHDAPDLKEFWHIGQELSNPKYSEKYPNNVWPRESEGFKETMVDVYSKLEGCALSILEACALYINEDKNRISETAVEGNSILRLIHYPALSDDRNPSSVRAAAHEDINLITLLIDATSSGLELLDNNGDWMPIITPKNCIIVDSGDMLQNLTNGFYKATTHRVVNPDNSKDARYSMPFFVHARSEVLLNPISSCLEKTGGEKKYPDITAGDYLHKRLVEIGLKN